MEEVLRGGALRESCQSQCQWPRVQEQSTNIYNRYSTACTHNNCATLTHSLFILENGNTEDQLLS